MKSRKQEELKNMFAKFLKVEMKHLSKRGNKIQFKIKPAANRLI
jgi:hypothetical protein